MFYEIDILLISSLLLKMALYVLGYWGGGGGGGGHSFLAHLSRRLRGELLVYQ